MESNSPVVYTCDQSLNDYDFGYMAIIDKQTEKYDYRFNQMEKQHNKYVEPTIHIIHNDIRHCDEYAHNNSLSHQTIPTHVKHSRSTHSQLTLEQLLKIKRFSLSFNVTSDMSICYIGNKLLSLHKYMDEKKIWMRTPIDLVNDYRDNTSLSHTISVNKRNKKLKMKQTNKTINSCDSNERLWLRTVTVNNDYEITANTYQTLINLLPESLRNGPNSNQSIDATKNQIHTKISHFVKSTETDVINSFIEKINEFRRIKMCTLIFDIIEIFLIEISNSKGIVIPNTFVQLYWIYRKNNRLPFAPLCVIDRDITIDQIWLCLTANEINFDRTETLFLSQMMIALKPVLSEDKYFEFSVRFSFIMVNKEKNRDFLTFALNLLSKNNVEVMASNKIIINYSVFKSIVDSQIGSIKSKTITTENNEILLENLASKPETEMTLEESTLVNEMIIKTENWQKGIDIISSRSILDENCLSTLKHCLESGKRARLSYELSVKLVKLAIENHSLYPWICLYWGIIAEEYQSKLRSSSIINYLTFAHQYLGRHGTCTSLDGEFLLLALQVFMKFDMKQQIIECFNCLYDINLCKKMSKKHQNDESIHCSPHIALKWENCEVLYGFLIPKELPTYDGRARYIHDIESLFLRIIELVPKHLRPNEDLMPIINYIDNKVPKIVGKSSRVEVTFVTKTIYYLMGDYYFQGKQHDKACDYYANHLRLDPNHFDSWAASALCRNYKVDQLLQIHGKSSGKHYYEQTFATIRCYSRALQLKPSDTQLWIEFGQFTYTANSNASHNRNPEFVSAQPKHRLCNLMIKFSSSCFESALKTESKKERWLSYYMLGKIKEKTGDLFHAIQYYEWAEIALQVNGASYPNKILYSTPLYLSVEALEIHYRIHAISLKYLCSNNTHSMSTLNKLKVHLIRALRSPFTNQLKKAKGKLKLSSTKMKGNAENINQSVSQLITDILESVCQSNDNETDSNDLRQQLITLCLNAMKRCFSRYAIHYKSIYRLAYYYFTIKDYKTAKLLLLNSPKNMNKITVCLLDIDVCDSESAQKHIIGLFGKRNASNFFREVLSIPIQDIDRPGSFFHHMYRSIMLLIKVCTFTQDYEMLSTIALHLCRKPEMGKWYLRDSDRLDIQKLAFDSSIHVIKTLLNQTHVPHQIIINDLYHIKNRFTKTNTFYSNQIHKFIQDMSSQ